MAAVASSGWTLHIKLHIKCTKVAQHYSSISVLSVVCYVWQSGR